MSLAVRFRLGSLLWMIALVAVVLGWWLDRHQLVSRYRIREEPCSAPGDHPTLAESVSFPLTFS
jgi:hypothetical protein